MKRKIYFTFLVYMAFLAGAKGQTWDEWFQQRKTQRKYLLQQIIKLQIHLGYLKQGYNIVNSGMRLIGNIKSGDLNLHTIYFDHLSHVSSAVYRYGKVRESLDICKNVLNNLKFNYRKLAESKKLSSSEIKFIHHLFIGILEKSTKDIEELLKVITDSQLKMTDAERIARIDNLHNSIIDNNALLTSLTNKIKMLRQNRQMEINDVKTIINLLAK